MTLRPNLYYRLDGNSAVYTGGTSVAGPKKLVLMGNNQGQIRLGQRGVNYLDAAVTNRNINFKVATPVITGPAQPGGGYLVGISDGTTNAAIYYTVDGSTPTTGSTLYTSNFTVGASQTVRALGTKPNYTPSDIAVGIPVTPVSFAPNGHNPIEYANGPINVQLTSEAGATIHYKIGTSGAWQTTSSGSLVSVDGIDNGNGVIQAFATIAGRLDSATLNSAEYSFRLGNPSESVSYNSGHTQGTITLSHGVSGAVIRYTTDGSVPNTNSQAYSSPISFTGETKVTAKGFASRYIASGAITAWVNALPVGVIETRDGILTNDITVNNDLEVWLKPDFGISYDNAAPLSYWGGSSFFTNDVPNTNFSRSIFGAGTAAIATSGTAHISYGRTYTLEGWFKNLVAGSGGDYAGLVNYDGALNFISAQDINESALGITYLTQPLAHGAITVYLGDEQVFNPVDASWYYNLFVPLTNFTRSAAIQGANQPNAIGGLYQPSNVTDWSGAGQSYVTSVNSGSHSVQLSAGYPGVDLPAGTAVAHRRAGPGFQYSLLSYIQVPTSWTFYQSQFDYMRAGTESISMMALLYSGSSGFAGLEFWEGGVNDRPNLYYRLDGSSSVYTGGTSVAGPKKLTLTGNNQGQIRLGQRGNNYLDAPVTNRNITFKVATPAMTATISGTSMTVTLASATVGASIYYTTDGTDPTTSGSATPYVPGTPFTTGVSTRVRAYGLKTNYNNSVLFDSQTDSDGDGLPDWWELQYFGNLGQNGSGDWDEDGVTNLQEYQQGRSPTKTKIEVFTVLEP